MALQLTAQAVAVAELESMSDTELPGAFDNVIFGERIATSDGLGSFFIGERENLHSVFLTDFQPAPVPEPGTAALLLAGLSVCCARRKSGERARLACWFRRPAKTNFPAASLRIR